MSYERFAENKWWLTYDPEADKAAARDKPIPRPPKSRFPFRKSATFFGNRITVEFFAPRKGEIVESDNPNLIGQVHNDWVESEFDP